MIVRSMILSFMLASMLWSQQRTVGLFTKTDSAFTGYTLFTPMESKETFLIDIDGYLIKQWSSEYSPGRAAYLLPDGSLLRTGIISNAIFNSGAGIGGQIQRFTWDGQRTWNYQFSTPSYCQHHDAKMLPNGNVLVVAWDLKTGDEAVAMGRNPFLLSQNELWPDALYEIKQTDSTSGEVVWEWHTWDHLIQHDDPQKPNYGVVADHPERIDINFIPREGPIRDWTHFNTVDYNPFLDQIVVSSRNFSEIWVIDHSTTTAEAKGSTGGRWKKGGDLLYRYGNAQVYNRGTEADQKLFGQHDIQWINTDKEFNRFIVHNNGLNRSGGLYSSIDEFTAPFDTSIGYTISPGQAFGPENLSWVYKGNYLARYISGTQRLPNGNTLVCNGPQGDFFEVTPSGMVVWRYVNPVTATGPLNYNEIIPFTTDTYRNVTFRVRRYPPEFPGFVNRTLIPIGKLERGTFIPKDNAIPERFALEQNYPNPFNPSTTIRYALPSSAQVTLSIHDILGREVASLVNEEQSAGWKDVQWNASGISNGIYFCTLKSGPHFAVKKMILLK